MHYDLTTLPNGLRIISEDMPSARSVAIACWVDTGSRDEHGPEAGASHFLEHLLFKGSERLSAQAIADAFDAVGARNNAFTSKEYTAYWARLRDAHLPLAVEIGNSGAEVAIPKVHHKQIGGSFDRRLIIRAEGFRSIEYPLELIEATEKKNKKPMQAHNIRNHNSIIINNIINMSYLMHIWWK